MNNHDAAIAGRRLWVGLSGWTSPALAKGVFYPRGLRPGQWLSFYAQHFRSVEINASFYRVPSLAIAQRWRDAVPQGFGFSIKLWRRITHEKMLQECAEDLKTFIAALQPLKDKLLCLLVQLPPGLGRELSRLESLLSQLKRLPEELPVAVEFRNVQWLDAQTYQVLEEHGAAIVLGDMPRCTVQQPDRGTLVYVRRHGPTGRYTGSYPEEALRRDAEQIRQWLRAGRNVLVYFNNTAQRYALDNARQLLDMLGESCQDPAPRSCD